MRKLNLYLSVIILFGGMCACFFFWGADAEKLAFAFTPKAGGDQFTHEDWRGLPDDFLDKSGDTMSGALNMGSGRIANIPTPNFSSPASDTANKEYTDIVLAAPMAAERADGSPMKIVCGNTPPLTTDPMTGTIIDYTNWQDWSGGIYVDIDTTGVSPNFLNAPFYFTSIGGNSMHFDANAAINAIEAPTPTSFRVRIGTSMTAADARTSRGWYINWCGVGT